jgi:hypothetical protein
MINAKFQPVVETLAMGWEQFRRQRHRAPADQAIPSHFEL